MRVFYLLLAFTTEVFGQGLAGSEAVILRVDSESIYAHLFKPQTKGPGAAMVLVHGFDGVSDAREGFWARELASAGVATLVIESFSARGVATSIANQSNVSTAQGVRDACAAAGGAVELRIYPGAQHGFDGDTRNERTFFFPQAQNLSECLLYIEDDGRTTYAKTGEPLDSPTKASEVMRRDCMKTGATIAADARVKAHALEDVKAFLKGKLL